MEGGMREEGKRGVVMIFECECGLVCMVEMAGCVEDMLVEVEEDDSIYRELN